MLRHLQEEGICQAGSEIFMSLKQYAPNRKCAREQELSPHLSADVPPSWLVHIGSLQNQTWRLFKGITCHIDIQEIQNTLKL